MKDHRDHRNRPRPTRPRTAPARRESSFADMVMAPVLERSRTGERPVEPLARLDYPEELALKQEALLRFWRDHRLAGTPETILPSPLPRRYRTTTKRRAGIRGGRFALGFAETHLRGEGGLLPVSLLEPEAHTAIYRFLHAKIGTPPYVALAEHLNYVIIRGSYDEVMVILNVDLLNAEVVRKVKLLGEHLKSLDSRIIGAFMFHDPTRSDYYLDQGTAPGRLQWKKLFGADRYLLKVGERRYLLPPSSFSQVNESMIPVMLEEARKMLAPDGTGRLLDLYCGYGLFSHYLGDDYAEIVGVDIEGDSITAAAAIAKRGAHRAAMNFTALNIRRASLPRALPPPGPMEEVQLLDPPRSGAEPGVAAYLAARSPKRVLHIFCGVDEIPRQLAEWEGGGYVVRRTAPLDMFAGTPNLEVMVLLERG